MNKEDDDSLQEVEPLGGLGAVRLGQSRESSRGILGDCETSFRRVAWQEGITDGYSAKGLMLVYRSDGTLGEIEIFAPCRPAASGIDLLGTPADDAVAAIRGVGQEVREINGGWGVPGLGDVVLRRARSQCRRRLQTCDATRLRSHVGSGMLRSRPAPGNGQPSGGRAYPFRSEDQDLMLAGPV